ncbi:type IV toxin-antitoxin system AbiEi family antitoxin [Sinomonas terrae]|uniref:Type IV toxin-antitoxin system AbiEi family antitoxin n=1 Tax=Sinomonas terrae TaxID=2908838 RepID=A0ABS9U0N1_9MICC|nr:type IV toxin-antitoxin system AbiEi family antitoxin [Sinomonas terrae]MCH6470257.1 type IV toxin-antitoxin system AbiEi family antitoxin [Sinomonas terrae]
MRHALVPLPKSSRPLPAGRLPQILVPGRPFTSSELQAMANDGVLQQLVGDSYAPATSTPTPELRAASLAAMLNARLKRRTVVGRMSAAWIYGCAPAPPAPVLLVPAPRRLSSTGRGHGALVHEVVLGDFDISEFGAILVTSPLRTAVDIAVHSEGTLAAQTLRRLLGQPGLGLTSSLVRRAVETLPRQPHKQRARDLLARLAAADSGSR